MSHRALAGAVQCSESSSQASRTLLARGMTERICPVSLDRYLVRWLSSETCWPVVHSKLSIVSSTKCQLTLTSKRSRTAGIY